MKKQVHKNTVIYTLKPLLNASKIIVVVAFCFSSFISYSQISQGGTPYSFGTNLKSQINSETLPALDVQKALDDDSQNDGKSGRPWQFGINLEVNFNIIERGTTETLPNGDKLVRFGIKAPNAKSLNFIFSNYRLPSGAKLYMYDNSKTNILGAFTDFNNQDDKQLGTSLITGDEVTFEYLEPANAAFQGELTLGIVTRAFKDVINYAKAFGSSGSCEVNVNCPEASGWECQKRAALMLLVNNGSGFCSGSLINNTSQNSVPYVLTANHCYNPSASVSTWVFYFNWESATCANPASSPANQTMSGASLKANSAGTDMALVQITGSIPMAYNAAFAGWSREGTTVSSSYGIHHPSADIKKFSISANATASDTYGSAACWRTGLWTLGVTEPGSSGSPLFDPNHRIIGQLYGGPSACNVSAANKYDYYGKFHVSWTGGGTSATRLSDWLDPLNTNATTLDGLACVPTCTGTNYTFIGGSVTPTDPTVAANWLNGCLPTFNDVNNVITINANTIFNTSNTVISGNIINNGTIKGSLNLLGSLTNNGNVSPSN
jgi:lysyl endopeptidase